MSCTMRSTESPFSASAAGVRAYGTAVPKSAYCHNLSTGTQDVQLQCRIPHHLISGSTISSCAHPAAARRRRSTSERTPSKLTPLVHGGVDAPQSIGRPSAVVDFTRSSEGSACARVGGATGILAYGSRRRNVFTTASATDSTPAAAAAGLALHCR
jgi:hypothetical protein